MKKVFQIVLTFLLSATTAELSCQNTTGMIDSIFITPSKYLNEYIIVDGTVIQFIPETTSSSLFYILKSDYGASIMVTTTSTDRPEILKKYIVKGLVKFEANGPIIIETSRSLYDKETDRGSDKGRIDVDQNIPESKRNKPASFALIIGNEDYTTYQTNLGSEVTVDYAVNDAEIFSKYVTKVFGIPEKNITLLKNATYGQMMRAINKFETISEILDGKAELIFYYSGHGLPDEESKEPYIMPVDASDTTLESAIKLNDVLSKLTTYPSIKVLAVIDACFSGGGRNQGLLAMKSVKIKPNEAQLKGNLVVLSSSTGEESSGVYREKQHGMFTYFLLKKLQESKGHITLKELSDYIQEKVELESVLVNNKRQTPQVLYSPDVEGVWEAWRLVE